MRAAEPRLQDRRKSSRSCSECASGLDDEDGLEPHWTSAVRQKAGLGYAKRGVNRPQEIRFVTVPNMQDRDKQNKYSKMQELQQASCGSRYADGA